MITKINLSLLAFFFLHIAYGQKDIPTTWHSMPSKTEVKAGEIIELIFQADIIDGWYLYSSDFDPDLGPVVATFSFAPNDSYELVGEIKPIGSKSKEDKLIWMGTYTYFTEKAEFRQKVKILKNNPEIKVKINAQVCSDESGKCIPILQQFNFTGITLTAAQAAPEPVKKNDPKKVSPQSPTGKTVVPEKNISVSKAEKTYSSKLDELRAEKELLILQSADGKDLVIEELEAFVKKYSKK
jgi:hypothetical protein